MEKTSIVGFIRYSQRVKFDPEKDTRDVFEKEYFDYRFKLFTEFTLKSFQQQTDMDFQLFLLHSESMPTEYRDRFNKLERDNVFLQNIYLQDNWSAFLQCLSNSINYVTFINDEIGINFRIDNDDAIHIDFIANLRKYCQPEYAGYVVSFPQIYILKRIKNGYLIEDRYYPTNTIGMAYITTKNNYKTILQMGDHTKINKDNPLILPNERGGLQTINGGNVSNYMFDERSILLKKNEIIALLKENKFPLFDISCLNIIRKGMINRLIARLKRLYDKIAR